MSLVDPDLIAAELDEVTQRESGLRLVHVGRYEGIEEFVLGICPGPMMMFEIKVASDEGMTAQELIDLATTCRTARLKLVEYVKQAAYA